MLLRSLCALTAVAWLVKALVSRPSPGQVVRAARAEPLLLAILAFLAVAALSTLTSIAPVRSFAGSYLRSQGLYTTACCVFLSLAVAANLRTATQAGRLVTAMILTSLPAAAYGIVQAQGLDPLTWTTDWKGRAASTQGNPVFLGALLCLVAPITLTRLGASVARLRSRAREPESALRPVAVAGLIVMAQLAALGGFLVVGAADPAIWWAALPVLGLFVLLVLLTPSVPAGRRGAAVAAAAYALALGAQVSAIVLSASRGPLLGLVAGCGVVGAVWLVRQRARRVRLATLAAAAAAAAVAVAAVAFATGPSERLSALTESGGGSGRIRVLVWKGSLELLAERPVAKPGGDPLNPLRPLLGYGPETFRDVYAHVYQPELGRLDPETPFAVPDRAHNALLDSLVAGGVLGLLAYLAVFHVFFALALERLGLVSAGSRRRVRALIGLTGLAGLGLYLAIVVWRGPPAQEARPPHAPAPAAVLGFLGLGVAHFVETLFGFGTISSLGYVWLAFGVVAAARSLRRAEAAEDVPPSPRGLAWAALYGTATAGVVGAAALWDLGEELPAPLVLAAGIGWVAAAVGVWAALRPGLPDEARGTLTARGAPWTRVAAVVAAAVAAALVVGNGASVAADVHFRNAVVRQGAGDRAGVRAEYALALRLAPRNDYYHQRYGELLAGQHEFRTAEKAFRRALALAPTDAASYGGLARFYRTWAAASVGEKQKRLLARAAAWYRESVRRAPRSYILRLELGRTELALGDHRAAVDALVAAVAVEPARDLTEARELLADAYLRLGDPARAAAAYRDALARLRPAGAAGAWRLHRNLAIAYSRLGARDRAGRELAAARAAAPAGERDAVDALAKLLGVRWRPRPERAVSFERP